jgi:hypothetical protein
MGKWNKDCFIIFIPALLYILFALSCSQPSDPVYVNSMTYNGVTTLNCTFSIPAGKGIHEAIVDVDTNDGTVSPALLSYQLVHTGVSSIPLTATYNSNRNWDLSDNGDDPSGGLHIYVSSSTDGSGHVVIRLRLVANPDTAMDKGLFSATYSYTPATWTFTITGFSGAHNLDVATSALNGTGGAIIPNPVDIQ